MEFKDIAIWQMANPTITRLAQPLGLFHLFNSWPFIVTILILGVNTLTCTILRFVKEGGFSSFRGPGSMRRMGFFFLHFSLILLFAGGFLTSATRMKARILLTEGQIFKEDHDNYLQLVEGPLRTDVHTGDMVRLQKVQIKLEKEIYPVDVSSTLEFLSSEKKIVKKVVRVNYPFTYKGLAFTQDKTGFSPGLEIWDRKTKKRLFKSFVAIQTSDSPEGKQHQDFLSLPVSKQKIMLTLFPGYSMDNGIARKSGDKPETPLLQIEMLDETGSVSAELSLSLGRRAVLGDYIFSFTALRRWSSFMVVDDPGYLPVCIAFWLGLGSLILRYVSDLKQWFAESPARVEVL